jgi:hypothetical protein
VDAERRLRPDLSRLYGMRVDACSLQTLKDSTEKIEAMKSLMSRHFVCPFLFACAVVATSNVVHAQVFSQPVAGVEINAEGVLQIRRVDGTIGRDRIAAAKQQLGRDLAASSPMRKVSLNRLEAEIEALQASGKSLTEAMTAMAGLTAVEYVFFYPETGDIVLAGPAEGFITDAVGRVRGIESGLPTILLEDVVTALRAFPPGDRGTSVISVSIDPTEEGLQRLNQAIARVGNVGRGGEARVAQMLKENLGLQTVSIRGVPAETHFAQVLVEADYRMKLIGIGLEQLPIPMASYVARSAGNRGSASAMERWYFEPNYECVMVSEDGLGMKLDGNAVRLVGAAEMVGADGKRKQAARANRASQQFCNDFTAKYEEIANNVPVYAQLRNLIDVSIAAAFIQQQDYATQAGWDMSLLMDESRLPVATHTAPHQVETAVNAVWNGNTLLTPLGGGVSLQPKRALGDDVIRRDEKGQLDKPRAEMSPRQLNGGQWWWD